MKFNRLTRKELDRVADNSGEECLDFVHNAVEAQRLSDEKQADALVEANLSGLDKYWQEYHNEKMKQAEIQVGEIITDQINIERCMHGRYEVIDVLEKVLDLIKKEVSK